MQRLKVKSKKCNSKITTFTFLAVVFSFSFLVFSFARPSRAISPSPESSPTAEPTIDENVQGIREAVKEKVKEKLAAVQRGEKKALVGEIDDVVNSTLVLTTRLGEKQVKVAEETIIIDLNRKEIELEGLEIGSYVIAMGYLENTDILEGKRIVIANKLKFPAREVAFGKVTDISEKEVLTVKNEKRGITYTLETTTTTKITKNVEEEREEAKFSEIVVGDYLVAIGTPSENEEKIITAKLIHVIPGKGLGLSSESAESAEETEQPSPIPSPKTTPSAETTP